MSIWLDSLILRLICQTTNTARPVWIILDRLASLQKLPQLATALVQGRKVNVRLLLGFQGRSQLEQRYGPKAGLLSRPIDKCDPIVGESLTAGSIYIRSRGYGVDLNPSANRRALGEANSYSLMRDECAGKSASDLL